jgi:eukaryotic-like serine/threonine-protein kinase
MTGTQSSEVTTGAAAPPAAGPTPERLGDFRILREIGRGGMGVVYEAEQQSLGRHVAVKVLPPHALHGPEAVDRFRRESRAAARLHHTNIVPVFGVGEEAGLHYYVMQFIRGRGLDAVLADLRHPRPAAEPTPTAGAASARLSDSPDPAATELYAGPADAPSSAPSTAPSPARLLNAAAGTPAHFKRAAEMARQVADALAHAHAHGTLHRDVKPANLLLDDQGTVWVTDFGLAKLVEHDESKGEVAGTLRYIPPERFRGESDGRGDVYSLGLTLYEFLTLRPAFDETDRSKLIHAVTQTEPPPPGRHNPAVPRDLETIVLKAIAKEPAHRYQTAGDLADDLQRFLDDRPIRARPIGPVERFRRWCRRNPALAGLTALAAVLLVLVAVVASTGFLVTRAALHREAVEHAEAESQRKRAESNVDVALEAFDGLFDAVVRRPGRGAGPAADEDEDAPAPAVVVSKEAAALLEKLLSFYDRFAHDNGDNPRVQKEAARAYRRVGELKQRLGQYAGAEAASRRALELYGNLARDAARAADFAREVAALHNELGLTLQLTKRPADARAHYEQALDGLRPLVDGGSATPGVRFEFARTHLFQGDLDFRTGRPADAEAHHRAAVRVLDELVRELPGNASYREAQARAYRSLSWGLLLQNRQAEGSEAGRQAVAILEKLAADFPDVPEYRFELGAVLMRSPGGLQLPAVGDPVVQVRKAAELARELSGKHPSDPHYQSLKARSQVRSAALLRSQNRAAEAEPADREAVRVLRGLANQSPGAAVFQLQLAEALQSLGETLVAQGKFEDGRKALQEAVDHQQQYLKKSPGSRIGRRQLADQYQSLALALDSLGQPEEAKQVRRKAEELRKPSELPRGPKLPKPRPEP